MKGVNKDYERVREQNKNAQGQNKFISMAEARANKYKIDWNKAEVVKPAFIGNKVFTDYNLSEIAAFIDWTPFFHSWEMKGSYPKILDDKTRGPEARKLFTDALAMLGKVIKEKWLKANAVVGIYPANAINDDDIEVHGEDGTTKAVFHSIRQQTKKPVSYTHLDVYKRQPFIFFHNNV